MTQDSLEEYHGQFCQSQPTDQVRQVTIEVLYTLFDNYPLHQFRHET